MGTAILFETVMTLPPLAYSGDITQFRSVAQQTQVIKHGGQEKNRLRYRTNFNDLYTLLRLPMSGIVDYNTST